MIEKKEDVKNADKIVFKNRRVVVALGETVSVGDYEGVKVHCSSSGDVADDVDYEEAYDQAFVKMENVLRRQKEQLGIKGRI